jgi:hypothetical protein
MRAVVGSLEQVVAVLEVVWQVFEIRVVRACF